MLIPIWYAGWEHACCGSDIRLGDFVEWPVYWEPTQFPILSDKPSQLTVVSETDVEAVWRWSPRRPNADGVTMVLEWGDLKVGVRLSSQPKLNGCVVESQGALWYEHHVVDPIGTSVGVVRTIYSWRRTDTGQSQFERDEPWMVIGSTAEEHAGDFCFMVEMDVEP
ncbi:MAG: hypothetical protein C7B43_12670 [Sulfobacillus benefaciens]|uniref:Uncharacterized protein n=1 Tax=Sulfobacillus benefaciens TaxID=453960 RepID=A0A2T2WXT1_9FIRM|nr:MAG: hypothetical protein C7B43_12670 [Sulfobacillus benefaciens]